MDNRGGGGGGRTPRGKKNRGSPRGRGQQGDSSLSRAQQTQSPSAQQSPTVSSSASASSSTPPSRGSRDEETKVIKQQTPQQAVPTPSPKTQSVAAPASSKAPESLPSTPSQGKSEEKKPTKKMESSTEAPPPEPEQPEVGQPKEDTTDKKEEVKPLPTTLEASKPTEKQEDVQPKSTPTSKSEEIPKEPQPSPTKEPELPELPPPTPKADTKASETTEAKVEEALGKAQPRPTAKTLVVSPPTDPERITDAPLTVDIDPGTSASTSGGDPQPSSSQGPGRSGASSPGYAYALRAPVGKPGYIGGVGILSGEGEANQGAARRVSAIAAVETAVKGFSKRQWVLLIMFGLVDLLSAVCIALQAPFYPAEAERKGATATEYGLVFGIFEFVVFLSSPIYGKYMNKLGPKTVFSVGTLVTSISVICFGLLDRVDDHALFIALCFICRIFEALGCAGFFIATFTIIACEFPESVATTFASLETFFGLGMILGPTVGGALFEVGGFSLPFFVVGGALLLTAFLSSFVMPKIDKATDEDGNEQLGYGVWMVLRIPSVALAAISVAATSLSLGYVSAILEPHIRRFGLTPLQTGLVFIVNGGVYALTAPMWGFVCDWLSRPVYVTILGNIMIFISFLIIGPASFMPFDTILWVTIVGLAIQGIGFGCCLVAGFIVGLKDSMKFGLPDNMATYGVASGLWTSMISLGAFVGPSVGGVLYDTVGFREGSWLILAVSLVMGVTISIHTFATRPRSSSSDSEAQPLLRPISPLTGKKDTVPEPKPSSYGSTSAGSGGAGGGDVPV
ncbi:unnamed protein product [Orchesella dallaii]|uniref:Major facilitator superfamily (MFS) profile domain-containing protein n=1 Tax=Orchesella dallaii TaxID=48710 RepID=A0ABP1Q888_9HEXA